MIWLYNLYFTQFYCIKRRSFYNWNIELISFCNMILHDKSCHPANTIKGISVEEFVISKRNCSTLDSFEEKKNRIATVFFFKQGCTKRLLARADNIVQTKQREFLLAEKKKTGYFQGHVFITTFSQQYREVKNIIEKYILLFNESWFP